MLRAFKKINQVTRVDAIGLADAGGATAATGVIELSGVATADGSVTITIGSRINHRFTINVVDTDTALVVGDKIEAAITADDFSLVTASNLGGIVTLTAKNSGTFGNTIGLENFEVPPDIPGLVFVPIVAMSGGTTDPVLTTLFDVATNRYTTVIFPGNYDESVLTGFLDPRFNANNEILDGVGVISKTDTLSTLKTFLGTLNSQSLIVHSNEIVVDNFYKGSALFEIDDVISAEVGALRSLRLTDGSNLSRLVIASNLDLRGGTALASLPYFNTPVFDLPQGRLPPC